MRNLAILLFEDVELLDFAGPIEVFSVASRQQEPEAFRIFTVAEADGPVRTRQRLTVNPDYTLGHSPRPHILLVPGGIGTRRQMNKTVVIEWIRDQSEQADLVLSVCTGALLLAKAGLLSGLRATTHHDTFDLLRETAPDAEVLEGERLIDNGDVILSAGVSAGIDMAFHVVARLLGEETAQATARHIEYDWNPRGPRGQHREDDP